MALTDVKSEQIQSSVALAGSPTTTTQSASDNSTKIATTAYVETAVANLVASAPSALNTLDELAAALNDDASFSTTVTNSLAGKVALSGSAQTIADSGNFTIDAVGDINLDADGGDVLFKDGGTHFGSIYQNSNNMLIYSAISDADMLLQGNDGGSLITALTLDMSAAGEATFNSNIISGGKIGIGTGTSTINADSVLHLKSTQPNIYFEDTDDSKSWRLEAGSVFKVQNITTSTEAFRVKQDGAFGIGTAPTDFFDVLGSVSTYDIGSDNSAEVVANFVPDSSSNRNGRFRIAGTTTPHNNSIALISDSSSSVGMSFVTTSGGTRGERVVIDSAGNVGISDTAPSEKLNVGGNIMLEGGDQYLYLTNVGTGNSGIYVRGNTASSYLRSHSTGKHVWEVAGSQKLELNSVGSLSLGPTGHSGFTGWRVLNIRGDSTGGMLNFENSSGTRSYTVANQGTGVRYQTHISGGYHRFETNAASYALYMNDAGDVGVGAVPANGVRFQTVHNIADEWVGDFKHTHANAYGLRVDLSGSTSSTRLAFGTYTGGGTGFFVRNDGNVGVGTTSPLKKLDILGEGDGYDQIMVRSVGGNNTIRSGGITGINYSGNQLALMNYYTDSGQTYYNIGSMGSTSFRGPTMIRFWTAAQNGTSHTETMRVTNNHVMAGAGARSADVALEVAGPLKITNNTNTGNGGVSQTLTNMTMGNSGKLIINFHAIGTMTTGDTIVFTYNAISWKSWFFKIRFSSTGGYIGELWAGGYNNNSDGYQVLNPRYYAAGSGDGASNTTVEGATLTVTRSGQANTMTLTLNNNHVHPLFEIEYACGGGEGRPNSSRASISINS